MLRSKNLKPAALGDGIRWTVRLRRKIFRVESYANRSLVLVFTLNV